MANILITGGTGYIGSNLISSLLNAEHTVTALVRESSKLDMLPNGINYFTMSENGDIQRAFTNTNIDAVIHLATDYAHEVDDTQVQNMLESNIIFGSLLLSAMTQNGCHRLINTTSCAEFDSTGSYSPNSLYAASKRAFRDICQYYSDTLGLKKIDLVLYDNYGTNDKRGKLVSLLCDALVNGTQLDLSPGEQLLNLIHIDDTVSAINSALDLCLTQKATPYSPLYSVAPENSISVKKLVSMLESIYDEKLNAKWGARSYRENELMIPWVGELVPNWSPAVDLENGLKNLLLASAQDS